MRKFRIPVADELLFHIVPTLQRLGHLAKMEREQDTLDWWLADVIIWTAPDGPDCDALVEVKTDRSEDGLRQTFTYTIIPTETATHE